MVGDSVQESLKQSELDGANNLQQAIYSQEASAIRSLQVINAGGAVALLAFIGQIWNTAPELRSISATSILLMSIGLISGVVCEFKQTKLLEKRYRRNKSDKADNECKYVEKRFNFFRKFSFSVFMIAILIMVFGFFCNISIIELWQFFILDQNF